MANLHFKRFGVILLESDEGDILFSDPSLADFADDNTRHETIIMSELIESSHEVDARAVILARQIVNYIERNRRLRWERVKAHLDKIREEDPRFFQKLEPYAAGSSLRNLRKIEKDVHFWRMQNDESYTLERPGKVTTK